MNWNKLTYTEITVKKTKFILRLIEFSIYLKFLTENNGIKAIELIKKK